MNESSIRQKLNAIAFPLIIQNVSGQAIALTDQMFIGRISTEAYAAIGIATSLMSFIAGLLGSMAVAFNIKGANELGKGNTEAVRTGLCSSLMLDSAMGLAYILIILSSAKFIFSSVYSLSGEALESSIRYSTINCPYILFQTIIFTFNSYFKIQNRTKHILWVSTCGALVNTMLDYILIFGKCGFKPLGVSGAAIASVTGVFLNMAIYILLARKDISFHIKKCKIYLAVASELTVKSIPLIGEELLEGSVFVIVINALLAKTGIVQTGAYLLVKTCCP